MAYNTNIGKQSFTAIAAQTEFDFNFKIFKDTDLLVYLTLNGQIPDDDIDKLILATNYTVTITGDTGGKVTLLSGASVGDTIVVQRNLAAIRETEYQTSGDLRAVVLNDDLNYQTYLIADNNLTGDNALRLSDSSVGVDAKLPSVIPEYFLRVNAAGTGFEFTQAVVQVISEVATSVFRLFDGTKKIAFDASNIISGQTRTITVPDNNVDLGALALKNNVLELDNTTPFTPDADNEPATKKYVDDSVPTVFQPPIETHVITTSSQAITSGVRANITNLTATITPSSASSRIRITIRWSGEFSLTSNQDVTFGIKRDTTDIGNPASAGNRSVGIAGISQGFYVADADTTQDNSSYSYIDTPNTTSSIDYHATFLKSNSGTLYNNRTVSDADSTSNERLTSTITLEEIGA